MRTIFFGASELGYNCCEMLLERCEKIVAIFTIPRKFNISYSPEKPVTNVLYKDYNELGKKYDIQVFEVTGRMSSYQKVIRLLKPDFLLAIGWYMIPQSIRLCAPKGCAGIHASLLPKYRGGAPLVWAMINGEKETGISFFYLEEGVDEGDIIAQKKIPIRRNDTIKDMLTKVENSSLDILKEYMSQIADNIAPRIPQNHEKASLFPQRKPEDGEINWDWDNQKIKNFIRAQTKPYPGAFTIINGKKIIFWDAEIIEL